MYRILLLVTLAPALFSAGFQSSDLLKFRSVGSVQFSPDGSKIAYTITRNDLPGRPVGQLWIMTIADGKSICLSAGNEPSGNPEWSGDGKWIAYSGRLGEKSGLIVARADGGEKKYLGPLDGTNAPLPTTGKTVTWSPDGKQIAYVSSQPGPETADATGDPVVITRYLYKPTAAEGNSHFNDNKRLHVFVADVASGRSRQLTTGTHYEHSVEWSPDGQQIAFVSNREPNEDQFFNYDLLTLSPTTGEMTRLTATENAEYRPHWSPDGKTIVYEATKRGLTDLETTMEDTHVWLIDANGKNRRELGSIDNRQGEPGWSSDGRSVYFTVQERGETHLYRMPAAGGAPVAAVHDRGSVGAWSTQGDKIAYAFTTPEDEAELYLKTGDGPPKKLTDLNHDLMNGKTVEPVESITFISKYASRGWATLMVNYRGSTGYGQAFTDAVFADQNGNEAQDVLYGLSAAMRRNLWIDRDRLGIEGTSYGGQLSAWLITQTGMFKAAVPTAAITNIISYNYMTYYNQYEQMEWGAFPHQGNLMDVLWERSALKHIANVHTPTMMVHGENDPDVPIAEAEQFYIGLRDVGVDAIMVRYPREGHGVRESGHTVDFIDRSIRWYEQHFPK
ncbi:MAG: prolyl oligopeptidase family serine peptidase [Bryobacteraceae bacterium]